MATLSKDYGEEIEEDQIKNWQFQQTKMNKSLNELIQNLNYGKSPNSKTDSSSGPRDLELTNLETDADLKNSSQSAAEFKRYLEDLKRSYLEKLAFSCPPKITKKISTLQSDANQQSSIDNNNKLKSVENLSNFFKKKSDLYAYETNSARRALFDDKNKSQEETSDKKSLLIDQNSAEPELSNTQILSRLVQIRDYLKQAYSMLTTLQTSNNPINYSAQMNKLHCLIDHLKDQEKGYMDLLNSLSKFQEMNQSIYSSGKETNENKKISIDNSFTNDSEAGSICGSFISDTLTLNCANANGINEIMDKYRKSINRAPDDANELVVVGKSFNKSLENEEDERTENDQDALEFDDDYLSNLIKSAKKNQVDSEQKEDAIRQMNIDRDTLEQLREQKQLLKSIRLRKEELKALEGRRKALEALKKIATDGEEEANDAFNILPITDQPKQENLINPSSICINRGVQTETLTPRKPMIRKTVKSKDLSLSQENVECVQIEPSSQIEKSKITAKHYEDLIRKILTEKYSENLVKTVSASDLLGVGQSQTCQKKLEQAIKEECTENEAQEELKLKLKDLADHEKKLDELYKMQSKLANLKTFMNEFEEMKKSNGTCDEEECDPEVEEEEVEGEEEEEEEEELKKENAAKKELIEIHKQKLLNAKEKLKELQNLISRLQVISDETGIEADFSVAEHKIDEQTNEYLKKAEIQQKEEKLDELNRNKQKLLELLSRKEQESALVKSSANDVSYLNEIESTFKAAENGFDMLSVENFHDEPNECCHSPSDLLWSKMKKQLAMRENLRNQKSELEDCIRDEYSKQDFGKSQILESKHEDANEILSAYRGFLMRGAELDKKCENDQDRESERSEQNSVMNRKKRLSESTVSEWGDDDQESKVSETKPSVNFDKLSDKIECILLNQQKMNEQIFTKFNELFEKKSLEQSNQNSQAQFQTQLHIQQLMFNLNTAYHEISTQRSEISRLNEQMVSVNKQLAELARTKSVSNTIGINTEWEERNEPSRASIVAALPSYFYNRKKDHTNAEKNDYTDDFEELDDEEEKKNAKKNELRTESSLSSTSNPRSSLSSSTLSLRKSLMKHRTSQNSALYKSLTFEKMREQIYSEVAALISQNESRPFYLLNLFKELQFIKDKNARDQALKSIFNISNRQSNLKLSAMKKSYSNEDKAYASKKYESDRQNEADEESTPFESDSLSNTVIFVKNSPKAKVDQKASNSSGSSIMGLEEEAAAAADRENIGAEVKKLISKIIISVKDSENFDSDEDSSSGSAERSKKILFNSSYLNETIEKVHQVLSQSAKHCDYLNYYATQLTCYLKDALAKYEDKYLVDCMEDVLIEISDILYNELTFYSTLKTHKKIENLSNSSSSLDSSSSAEFSDRIEQTEENFKKCKYQSIELLQRLSSILNNKFGDLRSMKEKLMDEKLALEKNKLEDFKYDLKKEFDELSLMTDSERLKEKYGASALKYVNASEPDSSVCGEDNFQSFETDSEKELPYRVVDADELKDNTITIDDLPVGNEEKSDETGNAMPGLDKIIMESICDQLVGNPDEIIKIEQSEEEKDNKARRKTAEDNGSLNSDSSNSDHFVIITDSKKDDDETKKVEGKCEESDEAKPDNEQGSSDQKNTQ